MAQGFAIKVDGLKQTTRALGRVDDTLRKEAGGIARKYALKVKHEAQARYSDSPGVRRRGYPFGKGAVVHRATATSASVGINRGGAGKNAAVFAAEFGSHLQWIPQKKGGRSYPGFQRSQGRLRRRTFPVWRGNATTVRGRSGPGWVILPILRKRVPQMEKDFETEMVARFDQAMRRAGVPG